MIQQVNSSASTTPLIVCQKAKKQRTEKASKRTASWRHLQSAFDKQQMASQMITSPIPISNRCYHSSTQDDIITELDWRQKK